MYIRLLNATQKKLNKTLGASKKLQLLYLSAQRVWKAKHFRIYGKEVCKTLISFKNSM